MKTLGIIVVLVIIIGGGWYWYSMQYQAPTPTPTSTPGGVNTGNIIEVALASQNNSGESGTAKIAEENGKIKVTLDFSGAPAGVTQPAHIHTGSCATIGGVKYPLTFPVNGKSETTLDVSMADLLAGLPLAINVHKSGAEANVYVACGDIKNTGPTPPPASSSAKTVIVSITSVGFSPKEVMIKAGDTVKFVNNDTKKHWPASSMHPTHLLCPGFDAVDGINAGESYSYTFTEAKTCPMH